MAKVKPDGYILMSPISWAHAQNNHCFCGKQLDSPHKVRTSNTFFATSLHLIEAEWRIYALLNLN